LEITFTSSWNIFITKTDTDVQDVSMSLRFLWSNSKDQFFASAVNSEQMLMKAVPHPMLCENREVGLCQYAG
jgi:hypothetical protein